MNLKRFFLALCALFVSITAQAQLANFTVTATKMNDETCPSNGAISWATSGTTDGSTLTYSIMNTATNTSVLTTSSTSFSGLVAGSYKIVATQTLGSQSNQATSGIIQIADQKVPLAYNIIVNNNEICGTDGKFTVNVTKGKPPYIYELLDDNNNVKLSQSSNIFTNLVAGRYKVRVNDQCGIGTTQYVDLTYTPSNFTITSAGGNYTSDCHIQPYAYTNGQMKAPVKYVYQYTDQAGNVQTSEGTIKIPIIPGVTNYPVKVTITDACGTIQTKSFNAYPGALINYIDKYAGSCGGNYFRVSRSTPFKITFLSAPAGFDPTLYDKDYGKMVTTHYLGTVDNPLPAGSYKLQIEDNCGNITQESITAERNFNPSLENSYVSNQCDSNLVTAYIVEKGYFNFDKVYITNAPQSFIDTHGPLPYLVPPGSYSKSGQNSSFVLNDVVPGSVLTINYSTSCDPSIFYTQDVTIKYPSTRVLPEVKFTTTCTGQFSYQITKTGYTSGSIIIQKYNPATKTWGSTTTQDTHAPGQMPTNNSYYYLDSDNKIMSSPSALINAPYGAGTYRVAMIGNGNMYLRLIGSSLQWYYCDPVVLSTFIIGDKLSLDNVYAYQCADGSYDVAVSASGSVMPYQYSIVSDETSSATVITNNGTNPIFHGLAGGSYYFRVMDNCGNFITRKLELAQLGKPGASVVADCTTNSLKMVVNGVDYLKFAWTKTKNADGSPTNNPTVLSTSNVLDLGTYEATEAGTYSVRMYTDPALGYCIDSSYEMSLTPDALTTAQAGTGKTVNINYDGETSTLNLFDYLEAQYDGFGTWKETTTPSSSLLTGSKWNVKAASPGTYTFQYSVMPPCGGTAVNTTVTINLAKLCYKLPVLSTEGADEPTKFGISSLGRAGDNTKGNWPMVRKGGWVALESNTKGFVVNRVAFNADGTPVGIPAANFVAGMMVFDTTNKCLKIYNGTIWSCFTTQTCPE